MRLDVVRQVARREVVERATAGSFIASTLILALIVLGFALIPGLIDGGDRWDLGAAGAGSAAIARTAAERAPGDARVKVVEVPDRAAGERALREGELDLLLLDGRRLVALEDAPDRLVALVRAAAAEQRVVAALRRAGVGGDELRRALGPPALPVRALDPEAADRENQRWVATLGAIFLYTALLTLGLWIAYGVVEEKSSRVAEVLLASVRPSELLAGKVLGIGVLGLAQLVVVAGVGLGGAVAGGSFQLPDATATAVLQTALWFLLGYALYSCAFAVAGAVVSRQEDLQSSTTPLSLLLLGGFGLSFAVINDPDSTLATVTSLVPPLAPMAMPGRAVQGAAPAVEQVVAILLTVGMTAALVALASRLYAGAILRSGGRTKLGEAWRAARRPQPRSS